MIQKNLVTELIDMEIIASAYDGSESDNHKCTYIIYIYIYIYIELLIYDLKYQIIVYKTILFKLFTQTHEY